MGQDMMKRDMKQRVSLLLGLAYQMLSSMRATTGVLTPR